ncbi:AtpZ/AtpI family protein [Acuticoccus mangrovi]|uniref:ATP synthase protein I n=1 Tax=Acuticoccus mangrovi TaxID=2796142 RepID=A0A934IID7_9HYPH|nr:AtpZ/AtpI family protein [Acuticoccus mangrovi]MBJ3774272.1 AtpZ/AtpI family protein [Acuticoccus mangrovi]
MAEDDFEERRERLKRQLAAHKQAEEAEKAREQRSSMAGYAAAFRLSTEFISAIVVGLALGYLADWGLGTTPWLMIVFLLLGFAAGVLNVLRSAGLIQSPQIGKRPHDGR